MIVDALGTLSRSSDINPGSCFFFDSGNGRRFGLLTEDTGHRGILILSNQDVERAPWIATGPLPSTMVAVPDVRIRTDWTSLTFGSAPELGEIARSCNSLYMRAALRKLEIVTINLGSGMLEDHPQTGSLVHFTRWTAGIINGNAAAASRSNRKNSFCTCTGVYVEFSPPAAKPASNISLRFMCISVRSNRANFHGFTTVGYRLTPN
jgi:hypothetical protein